MFPFHGPVPLSKCYARTPYLCKTVFFSLKIRTKYRSFWQTVLLFAAIFIMTYCEERADIYLLPKGLTALLPCSLTSLRAHLKTGWWKPSKFLRPELYIRRNYLPKVEQLYYVKQDGNTAIDVRRRTYGRRVSYRAVILTVYGVQEMNVLQTRHQW